MTAVFHVRSYGRFIETKSNFGRKKLHKMFLEAVLAMKTMQEPQSNLQERDSPMILTGQTKTN